ncbi:hypothetical protein QR510_28220, partial [Escherichia coli]|uniref:hypothetical protein n=1 Tax=Escherichia coli TaxID=562 RepID=UPI0027396F0B
TATSSGIIKTQAHLNQLSLLADTNQLSAVQEVLPQIQTEIASLPLSSKAIYAEIDFAQSLQDLQKQGKSLVVTPALPEIAQLLAKTVKQAQS